MDKKTRSRTKLIDRHGVPKKELENSQKNFNCHFCDYTTNRKDLITFHIRVHTREKPYKCQHQNCGAVFASSGSLKSHQLVHNKDDESLLKFRCSICPYKTGMKPNLNAHLKTHSDVKEFKCDLCPYRAKLKSNLNIHLVHVHSTKELLKCPEPGCSFSCNGKSNLNCHLKVHSSDRPFVCSFANCDFKSKWKRSLVLHKMKHGGEKPFKCSFCSFSCVQSSNLAIHIRVHTGETPYVCQICPYRAKNVGNLTKHVKEVHQGEKRKKAARIPKPGQ